VRFRQIRLLPGLGFGDAKQGGLFIYSGFSFLSELVWEFYLRAGTFVFY
jgi:hypothetical protein